MVKINPIGLCVLTYKEILRYWKVIGQTLFAPVVTNALFLIVFSIAMKDRIVVGSDIDYLQFLVPGLIMMGVLQNSFANACSSLIISKYNKTAVDLLMIPLSPLDLTLAYLISSITRGILIAIVTYLTAIIFIDLTIHNFLFTIFSLLMCSGTFAMLGAVLGLRFNDYDQVATIQNFILTPLSFLGGVFYSIKQLPSPFNTIAQFNPITYMINSLRYGILNYKDVNITLAVVVMTLFFSICFITAYKMFESGKGLRP